VKPKSWAPWLVALACFGPFLLAYALYYGPWADGVLSPLGGSRELLAAPVSLPEEWRSGDPAQPWQLVYARMTPCELPCASDLGRMLQVQLALGADRDLVRRAVWHVGDLPSLEDPGLHAYRLDTDAGAGVVAAIGAERIGDGRVFVADPLGNVILSYPREIDQKELLRDLKRLLRGSH
jgi:hypothetical protein